MKLLKLKNMVSEKISLDWLNARVQYLKKINELEDITVEMIKT